jgi:nicotinate-nucleotide--dimethylbenzimidazole phosphoribosyltransferase
MSIIEETIKRIGPVDAALIKMAEARQQQLTKPPGSLGRLEEIANRLCAIQKTLEPTAAGRRIVIFAADHGVAAEGVSAYPPEVTAQMVANFCAGGAAINALAQVAQSELCVVDIGVAGSIPDLAANQTGHDCRGPVARSARFASRRVRAGTRNMTRGAAMTEDEMWSALRAGLELAEAATSEGITLIGLGEMGIGNTTAASAVTAALTGLEPSRVTGRGTGADDATFARKVKAVKAALDINKPDGGDALDVLRKVGGLEIAGLCGLCLGAAAMRRAIITDGFIATAGAALAVRLCPNVSGYIFAAHLSPEPGHAVLLDLINQRPILDLEMRLGEGTGAALAMNIIAAAVAAFTEMATFESAGVTKRG